MSVADSDKPRFRDRILGGSGDSKKKTPSEPDPEPTSEDKKHAEELVASYTELREQVGKFIVGQEEVVEQAIIAIFAGGHCLLEGAPGLAKTMLVQTLSEAMKLSFRRIQFTPDLMPADITGTEIIQEDPESGRRNFVFHRGPLFHQMILADEINRTPPKTQAALLEAMQEHRVTVGQETYSLEEPFFVLATQNPIEQEGTYPLPEAQRDRFIFHLRVPYPSKEEEREIMRRTTGAFEYKIESKLNGEDIRRAQSIARKVPVPDHTMDYVLDLVRATRPNEHDAHEYVKETIDWGAGPRACQYLLLAGKVRALLDGRFFVNTEDIVALARPVLRHRIVPTFQAEAEGVDVDAIIEKLLDIVPRKETKKVL